MGATQVVSSQLKDGDVRRADLNTTVNNSAVITKLIAGTNISISYTGVDVGTGDVTVNLIANPSVTTLVATGMITAGTKFKSGTTEGKGGLVEFHDGDVNIHSVTVVGGIITSWVVSATEQLT
ncbi:MAG: hypothetical protein NUV65_05915 [Candidatus Roizmanbacteria bacterium]|nr:hypothetical protein [Candidatus Roizmanbacteria bacterium]